MQPQPQPQKVACDNECRTCTIDNRTYCAIETNRAIFKQMGLLTSAVEVLFNKISSIETHSPNLDGENSSQGKTKKTEDDKL